MEFLFTPGCWLDVYLIISLAGVSRARARSSYTWVLSRSFNYPRVNNDDAEECFMHLERKNARSIWTLAWIRANELVSQQTDSVSSYASSTQICSPASIRISLDPAEVFWIVNWSSHGRKVLIRMLQNTQLLLQSSIIHIHTFPRFGSNETSSDRIQANQSNRTKESIADNSWNLILKKELQDKVFNYYFFYFRVGSDRPMIDSGLIVNFASLAKSRSVSQCLTMFP